VFVNLAADNNFIAMRREYSDNHRQADVIGIFYETA